MVGTPALGTVSGRDDVAASIGVAPLRGTDAISADRQVTLVASTVAEITSQYSQVATSDVNNILTAAASGMAPFSVTSANTAVTLSSVTIDNNGNATIAWSQSLYGTPRTGTVTTLIPAGLLIPNTTVIWGEATYSYRPTVGWGLVGTVSMYDQIFLRPRQSTSVTHT
jgi:hypothetical protein